MIPDRDIFRSAQVLVKRHGQDAPIQAAMRADAMLESGDVEGVRRGGVSYGRSRNCCGLSRQRMSG